MAVAAAAPGSSAVKLIGVQLVGARSRGSRYRFNDFEKSNPRRGRRGRRGRRQT